MIGLKSILVEKREDFTAIDFQRELIGNYKFQGHISDDKKISLKNVKGFTEEDIESLYNQPPGFWTGTVIKTLNTFITDWIDYNIGDDFFHGFTVVNNPNILRIKTKSDVKDVMESQYGKKKGIRKLFDWKKIYKDFDAVHVNRSALDHPYLQWWGTESTLWFRPKNYLEHQFTWKIDLDEVPEIVKDDPKPPV